MTQERTSQATILVADDSEENRELLSKLLTAQGYRVLCVEDGAQALDVLASQPVDLALVEVTMPQLGGFGVCRAVKVRPEARLIPVVLMTGRTGREDRIEGIESGPENPPTGPHARMSCWRECGRSYA